MEGENKKIDKNRREHRERKRGPSPQGWLLTGLHSAWRHWGMHGSLTELHTSPWLNVPLQFLAPCIDTEVQAILAKFNSAHRKYRALFTQKLRELHSVVHWQQTSL